MKEQLTHKEMVYFKIGFMYNLVMVAIQTFIVVRMTEEMNVIEGVRLTVYGLTFLFAICLVALIVAGGSIQVRNFTFFPAHGKYPWHMTCFVVGIVIAQTRLMTLLFMNKDVSSMSDVLKSQFLVQFFNIGLMILGNMSLIQ